ncbi:hypothetical protein PCASD_19832 [Puccinia coronata f. sp. avenae]|uniref:Ecp2 effector protein domain-containing protein n=1 Tax=Puccinia coronata f. sp. avenae TaxID=200324 RepID=A0A2N5SDH5_9BASI|nr:hypothetical protein PCASD_19832 [Puccinia coronata f. sp. avenae]
MATCNLFYILITITLLARSCRSDYIPVCSNELQVNPDECKKAAEHVSYGADGTFKALYYEQQISGSCTIGVSRVKKSGVFKRDSVNEVMEAILGNCSTHAGYMSMSGINDDPEVFTVFLTGPRK